MFRRLIRSTTLTVALFVALVLVLSLQLWGLQLFGETLDYQRAGNWGNVTSSIASACAVVIAVAGFTRDRRRYDEERRRQEADERTRVFAWLEPRLRESDGERVWLLCFENQTKIPVYNWSIEFSDDTCRPLESARFGAIRPGSSTMRLDALDGTPLQDEPRISITFSDITGGRWLRDSSGEIRRVHDDTN